MRSYVLVSYAHRLRTAAVHTIEQCSHIISTHPPTSAPSLVAHELRLTASRTARETARIIDEIQKTRP